MEFLLFSYKLLCTVHFGTCLVTYDVKYKIPSVVNPSYLEAERQTQNDVSMCYLVKYLLKTASK